MKLKTSLAFTFGGIGLLLLFLGLLIYNGAFLDNVNPEKKSHELFIYKNSSLTNVIDSLKARNILINPNNIALISKILGYTDKSVKEGRYLIKPGMNNYSILSKLRSGNQDPVKMTLNNVRDIQHLCGKISGYLILDSLNLVDRLSDSSYLSEIGYTKENILSLFIPNTYELYWNTTFDKFIQRMQFENKKFWNTNGRAQKAAELNLKQSEVYTLASIVEKETNFEAERPVIAGVYLNRLKTNMRLQADPTVVFALGVSGLQRVLLGHLSHVSPYNTYLNDGLPPGPIYMPTINSLEAVLNPEKHDYIFFCAKEGFEGVHSYASTLKQHLQNAKNYQRWLNQNRIK
ncbi:MAG: endolytic transglycosylase MltG [Saprospiraceae bacterium]